MIVPVNEIDAGAQALRHRLQGGKLLTDWEKLPQSRKRKWLDYAACVLTAAASARQSAVIRK
jgi:hypothetical protein